MSISEQLTELAQSTEEATEETGRPGHTSIGGEAGTRLRTLKSPHRYAANMATG